MRGGGLCRMQSGVMNGTKVYPEREYARRVYEIELLTRSGTEEDILE